MKKKITQYRLKIWNAIGCVYIGVSLIHWPKILMEKTPYSMHLKSRNFENFVRTPQHVRILSTRNIPVFTK